MGAFTTWECTLPLLSYSYSLDSRSILNELKVEGYESSPNPDHTNRLRALLSKNYSFDALGNISYIRDNLIPELSSSYSYDALNRLKLVQRGSGTNTSVFTYSFDTQGNLHRKEETTRRMLCYNASCSSTNITTNQPHHERIWENGSYQRTNTFTWSGAGNLLNKSNGKRTTSYSYDARNMLRAIDQDTNGINETKFFYDESGQRFLKVFRESPKKPEIRTYYLGGGLEYREKWEASSRQGYQISKYIMGAGGQRIVSITGSLVGSANPAGMAHAPLADSYYALASVSGGLEAVFYWYKATSVELAPLIAGRQYGFILLGLLLILMLWLYRWRGESGGLVGSLAPVLIFSLSFSFGCWWYPGQANSYTTDSLYDGLPVGVHYYSHDHLGSSLLVTDEDSREVVRTNYTPYGEVEFAHTGKYDLIKKSFTQSTSQDTKYAILGLKFTGQEYDPESNLYYYNARYYDPMIGMFTSADTIVPQAFDPMSYNRYMYVRGNPIKYIDPSGHGWCVWKQWCDWWNNRGKKDGPPNPLVSGLKKAATWTYNKIIKPTVMAVTSFAINVMNRIYPLSSSLIYGLIGGIAAAIRGKNFFKGFGNGLLSGLMNWGLSVATFGVSMTLSAVNAYAAGVNNIYGRDIQGIHAFLTDHTTGAGTTAIGTTAMLADLAAGAHFEKGMSRGSGSFVVSGSKISKTGGISLGNMAASKYDRDHPDFKVTIREEILHNWQYRRGGLLNLGRLGLEQVNKKGNYPYHTPGTLEYEARSRSELSYSERPWELSCSICGRFY